MKTNQRIGTIGKLGAFLSNLFKKQRARKEEEKALKAQAAYNGSSNAYKARFNLGSLPPAYKGRIRKRRARNQAGKRG